VPQNVHAATRHTCGVVFVRGVPSAMSLIRHDLLQYYQMYYLYLFPELNVIKLSQMFSVIRARSV